MEMRAVMGERRAAGTTVHFGCVYYTCVEKNPNSPPGTPCRKYKGRAVFHGNNVKVQGGYLATCQELASCPPTMSASKVADFYPYLEGHYGAQADAEMAHTQTNLQMAQHLGGAST